MLALNYLHSKFANEYHSRQIVSNLTHSEMDYAPINERPIGGATGGPVAGGDWASATIAAAGSIANSLIQANAQKKADARNFRNNLALADHQYQKDVDMWNLMNQYNSPQEQMRRWKEAGLNPNLMYGQGNSGNASSMPTYDAPQSNFSGIAPVQLPNMVDMYQSFQLRQAQINNVKASTENMEQKTINESMKEFLLDLQGRTKSQQFDWLKQDRPYQQQILQYDTEKAGLSRDKLLGDLRMQKEAHVMLLLNQQAKRKTMETMDLDQENIKARTLFQQYQNDFAKMGITSSDNPFVRVLTRMFTESGLSLDFITPQKGKNWDKYMKDK